MAPFLSRDLGDTDTVSIRYDDCLSRVLTVWDGSARRAGPRRLGLSRLVSMLCRAVCSWELTGDFIKYAHAGPGCSIGLQIRGLQPWREECKEDPSRCRFGHIDRSPAWPSSRRFRAIWEVSQQWTSVAKRGIGLPEGGKATKRSPKDIVHVRQLTRDFSEAYASKLQIGISQCVLSAKRYCKCRWRLSTHVVYAGRIVHIYVRCSSIYVL